MPSFIAIQNRRELSSGWRGLGTILVLFFTHNPSRHSVYIDTTPHHTNNAKSTLRDTWISSLQLLVGISSSWGQHFRPPQRTWKHFSAFLHAQPFTAFCLHWHNTTPHQQCKINSSRHLNFQFAASGWHFIFLRAALPTSTQPRRKFRRFENRCPTWFNGWGEQRWNMNGTASQQGKIKSSRHLDFQLVLPVGIPSSWGQHFPPPQRKWSHFRAFLHAQPFTAFCLH